MIHSRQRLAIEECLENYPGKTVHVWGEPEDCCLPTDFICTSAKPYRRGSGRLVVFHPDVESWEPHQVHACPWCGETTPVEGEA